MSMKDTIGKKREKTVYITRDTDQTHAEVWDAEIGIRKRKGCVQFLSAVKVTGRKGKFSNRDCLASIIIDDLCAKECRELYDGYPAKGAAYLVEDKGSYWLWTRMDHNLYLLDWNGDIIVE